MATEVEQANTELANVKQVESLRAFCESGLSRQGMRAFEVHYGDEFGLWDRWAEPDLLTFIVVNSFRIPRRSQSSTPRSRHSNPRSTADSLGIRVVFAIIANCSHCQCA